MIALAVQKRIREKNVLRTRVTGLRHVRGVFLMLDISRGNPSFLRDGFGEAWRVVVADNDRPRGDALVAELARAFPRVTVNAVAVGDAPVESESRPHLALVAVAAEGTPATAAL